MRMYVMATHALHLHGNRGAAAGDVCLCIAHRQLQKLLCFRQRAHLPTLAGPRGILVAFIFKVPSRRVLRSFELLCVVTHQLGS